MSNTKLENIVSYIMIALAICMIIWIALIE